MRANNSWSDPTLSLLMEQVFPVDGTSVGAGWQHRSASGGIATERESKPHAKAAAFQTRRRSPAIDSSIDTRAGMQFPVDTKVWFSIDARSRHAADASLVLQGA